MSNTARSYRIDVLARALAVLDYLGSTEGPRTLSDVGSALELDKSRAFRILETLREAGYAQRSETDKTYLLGSKILGLKTASLTSMDFPTRALPRLQALSTALQDSVSIGVLDATNVRYLARTTFRRIISTNIEVGTLLPAHVTSMGKLLLSGLPEPEVRALYRDVGLYPMTRHTITDLDALLEQLREVDRLGYAVADEELELGLWGVAIPLTTIDGSLLAALSVSVPKARKPELAEILPQLRECAAAIAGDLADAHTPPSP